MINNQRAPRARARAVAIAAPADDRVLRLIHLLLAMLAPLMALALLSCAIPDSEKVDYGPEVEEAKVLAALQAPFETRDLTKIKIGEFVHFADTQEIAGGQASRLLRETGMTVIDREETATEIKYTVIKKEVEYTSTEPRKTATEIPFTVLKTATSQAASFQANPLSVASARILSDVVKPSGAQISYHNLKITVAREPAPALVKEQPDCLGVPDCMLTVHRVSFDQIIWELGTPNRVHLDFALSPDAPYLAQVLDKCATTMVPVGDTNSKTLLKQCSPVVSFRFEAPPPTPTPAP